MNNIVIATVLFLIGLSALSGVIFGRARNRRLVFAIIWLVLWAGAVAVFVTAPEPPVLISSNPTDTPATATPAPATSTPTPVPPTHTPAPVSTATQGPQGRILFHSDMTEDFEIWMINDDGTEMTQLTDSAERDIEPCWSPDGTQIAFASGRDDVNNLEIYIMNADGSNPHRLIENQPGDDLGPEWSPDGSQIAFHSNATGNFEIFVVNIDGTGLTNLSEFPDAHETRPSWSPDGSQIAFVSDRDGNSEIYVMNSDGSEQRRLTIDNAYDVMPKWSPDGTEILFESDRGVMNSIYLMSSDGTNVRLATNEAQKDGTPGWGNNGERFYFTSIRSGAWEIYVHDLRTGQEKRIMKNGGYNRFPAWAPPAE